ncbi:MULTISPECIES: septum formation initiator family protein [Streptomyces]|uniref:Septum formation initiator family protein n=1 Tax=Streptomyces thermoviolaceus subsp. thermoviolaceus TaxID=66860 RepID=A0ABX0Z0I4_STRTL|nr:septum formation initiator family protein [Streptomyces thermoviolaceus]NJP16778.1 septum formation initiator family protein [Streptomyces thermoviolaceus subsp. thermoviolaceus]WTD49587.1 septum formation initiator family protein [Streptomyces thermoviolaceus]GGV61967.1 membrane protein [Streptomyces thermoviolaceus subsp. apingens]GHA79112.1 membrane protein [Streptomyces thermoviolaceus subsp. thermoviolaceus]
MSRRPELRGRAARLARMFPAGRRQAARTPFVLLVVLLLGGGLIGLLVLNSALSAGAFQRDDLQRDTKNLTDEEQALQRDIDSYSAPDALERRARELGMVPGGDPAFLDPDGTVKGVPSPAARQSSADGVPLSVRPPEALTAPPSWTDTGTSGTSDPGAVPELQGVAELTPSDQADPAGPPGPDTPDVPGPHSAPSAPPQPVPTTTPGR